MENDSARPAGIKGRSWRQPIDSSRIEALRRELEVRPSAIHEFWQTVASSGAPLVEEIPGEPDARCVTFVYRDWTGDLEHVLLGNMLILNDFGEYRLTRVGTSDLLALSLRLPSDTATTYVFAPNGTRMSLFDRGSEELEGAITELADTWEPDPLNSRTVTWPFNEWTPGQRTLSVLELADMKPWAWSLPAAAGEPEPDVDPVILESDRGGVRRLWYLRVGAGVPQRLFVALDGWQLMHICQIPLLLIRLHAAGLIPPLAAVFVDSGTVGMRLRDYWGSREYSDYLALEVVPAARRYFDTAATPETTIIYGGSAGGVTSLATAFRHPDVFGNVLALSTPAMLVTEDLPDGLIGEARHVAATKRPRIHLQVGILETDNLFGGQILGSNRELLKSLAAMGFDVALDEESCGHDVRLHETMVEGLLRLAGSAAQ